MSAISSHSALKIEKSRKTQMFLLFTSFFEKKSSLRKFVNALFGKIWLITFEEISTTLTKIARFLWNSEHYGQTTTHFFLQTFTLKKCQMMTDFTIYFFLLFRICARTTWSFQRTVSCLFRNHLRNIVYQRKKGVFGIFFWFEKIFSHGRRSGTDDRQVFQHSVQKNV